MNVAIELLATQAKDVQTFTRHGPRHGLADRTYDFLQFEVLTRAEVADHVLAVFLWGDEDMAPDRGPLGQKGHGDVVLVDDVVVVVSVAGDCRAHEALRAPVLHIRERPE
jgi:hypothetical protein